MKCPKCGSINEMRKHCGECGEKLQDKCRVCGELEPISLGICRKRVKEIMNEKDRVRNDAIESLHPRARKVLIENFGPYILLYMFFAFVAPFLLIRSQFHRMSDNQITIWYIGLILGIYILLSGIHTILNMKLVRKSKRVAETAEQRFWSDHPDFKAMIDKFEAWEKAQQ